MKLSKRFYHNSSPRVPIIDVWLTGYSSSYANNIKIVGFTFQREMQNEKLAVMHDTELLRFEMTSDEARNLANRLIQSADEADRLENRSKKGF